MNDFYGTDLAYIHASAFEHLARAAATELLSTIPSLGKSALVLDLGCGAGPLSDALAAVGCAVWGVDISSALLNHARARVSNAVFVQGDITNVELPSPANVVCAIGEVLNYATVDAEPQALLAVFRKIRRALPVGGVFLFDLAIPGRSGGRQQAFAEGLDWAVGVTSDEENSLLTRRITTFRRVGQNWRRSFEVHRLRLWPVEHVLALLKDAGFEAVTRDRYGATLLPSGLIAYWCTST